MSSSLPYTKHLEKVVNYNQENYSEFLTWMQTEPRAQNEQTNPFVYLVDSQSNNTLQFHRYLGPGIVENQLNELRIAVENPNDSIRSRLVIVNTRQQHLSPDLIDILGMVYDIEPQYFLSIVAEYEQYRIHLPSYRHVVPIPQYDADFIHLELIKPPGLADAHNHAWIKTVRQNGHSIIIIFLSTAADKLASRQARPAVRPSDTTRNPERLVIENDHRLDGVSNIHTFLEELKVLSKEAITRADAAPLNYIHPLIQGFELMVGKAIQRLQACHQLWLLREPAERTATQDNKLYSKWRDERLCLENAISMTREVRRYSERKNANSTHGLGDFLLPIQFLIQEGNTLEAHVRDQLNLHIGSLSLEESRKSIEESKRSIKQARAMGRVTFLGLIFLPLSLVTSFFGMHIKEITGDGSSLRALIIASITIEAVTLAFWFFWVFTTRMWEAAERLAELDKLQKGGRTEREYLTLGNLWRESKPKFWFQSKELPPDLPKESDSRLAYLEDLVYDRD